MIIHFIHYPVSAKRFVEPLVNILNDAGFESQLWLENRGWLADFISAISCPKQFARFDISVNPLLAIMNIFKLARRLKIVRPSAVHCHQSRASFIPLFSALLARVPVRIYHNHGAPYLGYNGPKRWGLWLLEFFNCLLATNVLTVTPAIRDKMIESRIVPGRKILCLGAGSVCGIDLDEFRIEKFSEKMRNEERRKLNIGTDAFVVLYIGRPLVRKGFNTLLQAWQIFCRLQPDAEKILLIAGCGLKDIVESAGSCPAGIVPLGCVTEMHQYYAACDVVALPSRHEGMPYSLLEGAAAERPLVASNIPGIDSLVKHGQNGLLADPHSPEDFADAFNLLYTKPQLRMALAANARKNVENYFDRKICGRLLTDYYYNIGLKTIYHR